MKILYIEEEDRLKHKTKHERNNLMKGKKESYHVQHSNQCTTNTDRFERYQGKGRETSAMELTRQPNKKVIGFNKHLYNNFKYK